MSIKSQLGVEKIDMETGTPLSFRKDFASRGNDEERVLSFQKAYPKGKLARVNIPELSSTHYVYVEDANDPNEVPKLVNPQGLDVGDLGDFAANWPEMVGAIGAGIATRGASLLPQSAAVGGGAALGRLAKEGGEAIQGESRQTGGEILFDAATEGVIAGGANVAAGLLGKLMDVGTGRGLVQLDPERKAIHQQLQQDPILKNKLFASQLAPESRILGRFTQQGLSSSKPASKRLLEQIRAPMESLLSLGARHADRELKEEAKNVIRNARTKLLLKIRAPSLEKGGQAAIDGLKKDFVKNSAKVKNDLYNKVDNIASSESPLFDITNVFSKADDIVREINAESAEGLLKGAPAPNPLIDVINDLRKISPVQADYRGVKSLRTRLFDLIDNQPWQWDTNKFRALGLWRELSNSLNRSTSQTFNSAIKEASKFTKDRYDILKSPSIQKIIKSDKPFEIGKILSRQGEMTQEIESALKGFAPQRWRTVKDAVQHDWLTNPAYSGKAVQKLNEFRVQHPEGFKRLVDTGDRKLLFDVARKLDAINNSDLAKIAQADQATSSVIKNLLSSGDIEAAERLARIAPPNTKAGMLIKTNLLGELLEKTVKTEKGVKFVDQKAFNRLYTQMNRSGVLDIFLKDVKQNLSNINEFLSFQKFSTDAGTSLELAQAITNLKHPKTALKGVHVLGFNRYVGAALTNPNITKILTGPKASSNRTKLKAMSQILTQIIATLPEQSDGTDN